MLELRLDEFLYTSLISTLLWVIAYLIFKPKQQANLDHGLWHDHSHIHDEHHSHNHSLHLAIQKSHSHLHFHHVR